MAIDAYLKIEGINGESEDDKHRNWIEVSNDGGTPVCAYLWFLQGTQIHTGEWLYEVLK